VRGSSIFLSDQAPGRWGRAGAAGAGTAVFLTSGSGTLVLLHHFKHNKVFHETVVLSPSRPRWSQVSQRARDDGGPRPGCRVVALQFMNSEHAQDHGALSPSASRSIPWMPATTWDITLIPSGHSRMARWRKRIFVFSPGTTATSTSVPPTGWWVGAGRVLSMRAALLFIPPLSCSRPLLHSLKVREAPDLAILPVRAPVRNRTRGSSGGSRGHFQDRFRTSLPAS
jgi:hypothetical protein